MLKHYIERVFEREIWQRIKYFFRIPPRSKILSTSDCTRTATLLTRPSIHLNRSLTRLKSDLGWNTIRAFLSAKFDNVSSTFFVYHLSQKFFPPQTVLGQGHSSLDPQFIWISPWPGWKAIYVETLYSAFLSAKFDNVSSTFFVYHLGQKLFPPQTALGQWHPSLDPQFIWIRPWLGWKRFILKHYIARFWARNLTTYQVLFSYTP